MRRFKFQKLIRDDILSNMQEEGCDVDYRILESNELDKALIEKLAEEVEELQAAAEEGDWLEEAVDLHLVYDALVANQTQDEQERLERLHHEKLAEKGGFEKGVWVESVAVPEDSPWLEYLADNYQEMEE